MPQIFRPRANELVFVIIAGLVITVLGIAAIGWGLSRSPYVTGVGFTPQQPVPFSHKHHTGGLGIDCRYCHTSVEKSAFAGVPPTHTCMTCHSQLWTNAQMLAPVRVSLKQNKPLHWRRVTDLPDFVYFDHSMHVNNGIGCESCHGRVDQMALMRQAKPLTMAWCLSCHTDPGPHLRPPDKITAMGYAPSPHGRSARALLRLYEIDTDHLIECYTCHR